MIKFNVISNYPKWKNYLKDPDLYIKKQAIKLNKKQKDYRNKLFECTLLLSESQEIKVLNKKFRNKNQVTDVLSFPFFERKELKKKIKNEKEIYLGDIIINLNKIKFKKNSKKFLLEFNKLWVHGLVHLFGYDHKKDKDFFSMLKIEKRLLSYLS
tara:strand:+ start:227 stop:691 length:465 start_codon:yes stop_codon:yes gene_type:complete